MNPTITLQLQNGHATATITGWDDTATPPVFHAGHPAGYGYPVWSADDAGALVSLAPLGDSCTLNFVGVPGSFNLTATMSKPGSPNISITQPITLAGSAFGNLVMTVA